MSRTRVADLEQCEPLKTCSSILRRGRNVSSSTPGRRCVRQHLAKDAICLRNADQRTARLKYFTEFLGRTTARGVDWEKSTAGDALFLGTCANDYKSARLHARCPPCGVLPRGFTGRTWCANPRAPSRRRVRQASPGAPRSPQIPRSAGRADARVRRSRHAERTRSSNCSTRAGCASRNSRASTDGPRLESMKQDEHGQSQLRQQRLQHGKPPPPTPDERMNQSEVLQTHLQCWRVPRSNGRR